jgi:hypothetical protein
MLVSWDASSGETLQIMAVDRRVLLRFVLLYFALFAAFGATSRGARPAARASAARVHRHTRRADHDSSKCATVESEHAP